MQNKLLRLLWIISWGKPCSLKILFIKALAVCFASGICLKGIKWIILEKRSTTTIITVYPLESGRPHRKSISIDFQGFSRVSKGCRRPYFLCLFILFLVQDWQEFTYLVTSSFILGHQKFLVINSKVLLIPKWPAAGF